MVALPRIRKRMKRREAPGRVRFATFSCQRRLPLLSNHRICEVFMDRLGQARVRDGIEVIAWVLMPEHVHLLVRPGTETPLGSTLRRVKLGVSKRVIARWRALGAPILEKIQSGGRPRFWQAGGGFDRNVRDEEELTREIRYIHDNPVERGLVVRAEDWKWSSIHWWMGQREGEFPCCYPLGPGWERWTGYVSRPRSDGAGP